MHRHIRWKPAEGDGLEHLDIRWDSDGVAATGVLIGAREGAAFGLRYQVLLTPDWLTRRLRIERTDGAVLEMHHDGAGRWSDATGAPMPELAGCLDIDISGTPFTNTLPINRARFVDGRPERFDMAWIPLDTLEPFRDGQIYTRIRPGRFRYQAADGSFEAEISTDADGFVTEYPGLFTRA